MIELNNSIRDNAKRIGQFGAQFKGLQDKMVFEQFMPFMFMRGTPSIALAWDTQKFETLNQEIMPVTEYYAGRGDVDAVRALAEERAAIRERLRIRRVHFDRQLVVALRLLQLAEVPEAVATIRDGRRVRQCHARDLPAS